MTARQFPGVGSQAKTENKTEAAEQSGKAENGIEHSVWHRKPFPGRTLDPSFNRAESRSQAFLCGFLLKLPPHSTDSTYNWMGGYPLKPYFSASLVAAAMAVTTPALAGLSFAPYASIKSTKSVVPGKKSSSADGTETETIKQRKEFGLKATLSFFRVFKTQLSVGQSRMTTTQTVSTVSDEYGEIDLGSELNMDTSDPDKQIKLTETQNVGKFSLMLDPSFSIIVTRFKLGMTARQRIIVKEEVGALQQVITEGPTYNPHSGLGVGIKFSPKMYIIAEYEFLHYKYPTQVEPFEREFSISYNLSL